MAKLAFIAAHNPGYSNPGMLTVDLAAHSLKAEIPNTEFNWFSFPPQDCEVVRSYIDPGQLPFNFHCLPDSLEWVYEHDAILYWGDFLNARSYLYQDAFERLTGGGYSSHQVQDILLRCMLLRDAPDEVLQRTLLFGGTILPDNQSDYEHDDYYTAFVRLATGCRAVWMRDPISAATLSMLRSGDGCMGTDAALLLPETIAFPTGTWSEGNERSIGLFVGVRTAIPEGLPAFAEGLANRFSAKVDWLPWLDMPPFKQPHRTLAGQIKANIRLAVPGSRWRAFELQHRAQYKTKKFRADLVSQTFRPGAYFFGDLLQQLKRYEFVITDTYHLCLNAWRLGTPAICIGLAQPDNMYPSGTLNDLKKYIFYLTYKAADLYFTPESLESANAIERAASLLESKQVQTIQQRIKLHAQGVKAGLMSTLGEMLGSLL